MFSVHINLVAFPLPPPSNKRDKTFFVRWNAALYPFSCPEATILLVSTKDRDLWPEPIFWACGEYSLCIFSQSDLPDLTKSPWIADFRCWSLPEVSILGADQKDRGLWARECLVPWTTQMRGRACAHAHMAVVVSAFSKSCVFAVHTQNGFSKCVQSGERFQKVLFSMFKKIVWVWMEGQKGYKKLLCQGIVWNGPKLRLSHFRRMKTTN